MLTSSQRHWKVQTSKSVATDAGKGRADAVSAMNWYTSRSKRLVSVGKLEMGLLCGVRAW